MRSAGKSFCTLLFGILCAAASYARSQDDTTGVSKPQAISEIVVTGTRSGTDIRHLPMTVSVVGRQQIEESYQASLLPVLTEQVPGFFSTSRGMMGYGVSAGAAGGMSLRGIGGTPTTGILVLIDGHPQYMGLMGHPLSDAYQSILAERVEVLRGASSVLYGSNAMGGVVNIVTRRPQQDGMETDVRLGYGSYNTLVAEAVNQVKEGRFSSAVSLSGNRSDNHRPDMGFGQYGGYARVGYEITPAWNVSGDADITHFDASNPGPVGAPLIDNDAAVTRGAASLSLENNYDRTSGAVKLYYNWGRHLINEGYKPGQAPLDYRFNSKDYLLGVSWYQSATLFRGNRLTAGMDYAGFGGRAWNRYVTDGHLETIADKSEREAAAYLDMRQELGRYLTFDAGFRLDHHSVTGSEWVPQAGLSARLPHNATLRAMASKGFRNPTIRELYLFGPANADLLPERLWSYEVSFSQELLKNALHYGANIFYINGDNMIQTIPVGPRPMNVNTGKVENWGVEADVAYRISRTWNISANYSWLHMKYPVVAAPQHKLFAGAGFAQGRWNISTGLQYIAGLYTSVSPVAATENFLLWDVRGGYRLSSCARLFVRGENLLAQRYQINAGYPMPRATILAGIDLRF